MLPRPLYYDAYADPSRRDGLSALPNDVISPWLVELLKRLKARGHDVEVFTSAYKGGGGTNSPAFRCIAFATSPRPARI